MVAFNLSLRTNRRSGQMNGSGLLIIAIAALAAYMGMSWERARRAIFDVRVSRKRVQNLRQTAMRERFHAVLIVTGSLFVIFMIARNR
ncbi:hypothetical protein GCM10009678_34450 [Actinomadura kijaniata]|uniref:Multisubunit Na+/H+ antiporter MnhB subunit n=1 Tax=Actinomadura namibiensis TaxID=182080 RepID=A0A7W3LZ31_ACTNM|nr:hypothetical protein [Actinomadura namibiensis]MBA8956990.1 multisubunit Na+/H+ antiporter MnhB subunit [Actinomadura namibiensis]